MAIRFYDEAVANKINSWLPKQGNRTIKVLKPDETRRLLMIEADERDDKPIQLPLIALSRDTQIDVLHTTKRAMSFDGMMLESDGEHTLQLDAIPISISYQMDLYTRYYDEGDDLLREMIFKLINNPQVVIELPYNNQKIKQVCAIKVQGQVEDTSSISERLFSGQFTRWTLRFDIDGAYLYSIPYVDNVHIESELEVIENKEKPYLINKEIVNKLN